MVLLRLRGMVLLRVVLVVLAALLPPVVQQHPTLELMHHLVASLLRQRRRGVERLGIASLFVGYEPEGVQAEICEGLLLRERLRAGLVLAEVLAVSRSLRRRVKGGG
jgi:hypothetical protein